LANVFVTAARHVEKHGLSGKLGSVTTDPSQCVSWFERRDDAFGAAEKLERRNDFIVGDLLVPSTTD
jgi:hypothetical protein